MKKTSESAPMSIAAADAALKADGLKPFVSPKEAALALGLRYESVWRFVQSGLLKAKRIGAGRGHWRIARIELARFLAGNE